MWNMLKIIIDQVGVMWYGGLKVETNNKIPLNTDKVT